MGIIKPTKEFNKVLAKCLLTHPDENDMMSWYDGEIEPFQVKIYYRDKFYPVNPNFYDEEYFELK